MARVTVEDCLEKIPNRFALVVLASERARQIASGSRAIVRCDNKAPVTALREIAAGKVAFNESVDAVVRGYLAEQRSRGARPVRGGRS